MLTFVISVLIGSLVYVSKKTHFIDYLLLNQKEHKTLHQFYTSNFSYYNLLNPKEKRKFIVRVINIREWNKLNISSTIKNSNNEIELLISAAFAQITFGYDDYEIEKFNKLVIHSDTFYSRLINHQVKGLTVGTGYIHYSWEDFRNGYRVGNDKINLALHELAHALYIDRFIESEDIEWRLWKTKAISAIESEHKEKTPFFRVYGKTNLNEFWAVTVECFFEDPINFRDRHPGLYNATTLILKQDMALKQSLQKTAGIEK